MDPPQNVASLQSFNGMVNHLKKFSPVLSELSEPLRRLCKSAVEWAWESEQQSAFEAIKQVIMTLPVLAYFDKTKQHTIQCDEGLGAVLLQESKPVMYVSKALTETEQRYSNIEKELLAIVFALERLHHYTFATTTTVAFALAKTYRGYNFAGGYIFDCYTGGGLRVLKHLIELTG